MILLCAQPGARINFLSAILENQISNSLAADAVVPPGRLVKAHIQHNGSVTLVFNNFSDQTSVSLDQLFEFTTVHNLISVRVKLVDHQDIVNAAYLENLLEMQQFSTDLDVWRTNPPNHVDNKTYIETIDKDCINRYNLTIDFKELWNINSISKIYTAITGKTLYAEDQDLIRENIAQQPELPYPYKF